MIKPTRSYSESLKLVKSESVKIVKPRPFFRLASIAYSEYLSSPNQWILDEFELDEVNLFVGRNSAGKSRIVSVINSLAKLLSGEIGKVFVDGKFKVVFVCEDTQYTYELSIRDSKVVVEKLTCNNKILLDRSSDGIGIIWAERIGKMIDFEAPQDQLAAKARRDSIQHPFFEDLYNWASLLRFFAFGSPLGRDHVPTANQAMSFSNDVLTEISNTDRVTQVYAKAFIEFGDRFDKAVLKDLEALGYKCSDVGAQNEIIPGVDGKVMLLFVKERDIATKTTQITMSQGMFRALSLVIQLNYIIFKKIRRTVIIDDIGEGLDFSRSQGFISLLIDRARANKIQLLMTSNDRFVMNGTSLNQWCLVERKASRVQVINFKNSPQIFEDYEELGLNNFDFFAGNFFKPEH